MAVKSLSDVYYFRIERRVDLAFVDYTSHYKEQDVQMLFLIVSVLVGVQRLAVSRFHLRYLCYFVIEFFDDYFSSAMQVAVQVLRMDFLMVVL